MAINRNSPRKTSKRVASIALSIGLAACSGKHNPQSSTQVAAKVGAYEITNFELNNALARVGNIPPEQAQTARSAALESLVREQLLLQQAQSEKLDRQPQVVAAIEEARRGIIVRAYAAQITDAQLKPTEEDIHQYYQQHPELFAARRMYTVKEITTPANTETAEYLRDFAVSGKTVDQFGQWLQDKKIVFQANSGNRDPESLPISFLPQLAATKDGGTVVFNNGPVFYVAQILSSHPAPITEEKAAASIRRFLTAQRSKAAIDQEIARLRANTKIEYEGEFAKVAPAAAKGGEQFPILSDENSSAPSSVTASLPN